MLFQYESNIPVSVETFPPGCARSVPGALYLRPHDSVNITEDEWKHLSEQYPGIAQHLRLLDVPAAPPPPLAPMVDPLTKHVLQPPVSRMRRMPEEFNPHKRGGEKE